MNIYKYFFPWLRFVSAWTYGQLKYVLILLLSCAAFAAPPPESRLTADSISDEARTVVVQPNKLIPIYGHVLVQTMVQLPDGENLISVAAGDPRAGVEKLEGNGHFFSVKPTDTGIVTDIQVITEHNLILSFKLIETSGQSHQTDALIILSADGALRNKLNGPPVFVSSSEAERLKKEAADAKLKADQAIQADRDKVKADEAAYRTTLMANMDCNYEFTNKENYFHISSICSDGVHTIIKAKPDEMPAVYELKDGTKDKNGSIINDSWDATHNQWVIDRVVKNGFLRVGKRRQDFRAVS